MKKIFFLSFCIATVLPACSQQDTAGGYGPLIIEKKLRVGNTTLSARQLLFSPETPFTLVVLHSNEATAEKAARNAAEEAGIYFFHLRNNGKRLVSFQLANKVYQFDPNRIFSDEGIKKTLLLSGLYSAAAFAEVKRFTDSIVTMFVADKPIVAVHNNTDGKFSIHQYKNTGGKLFINPEWDEDDFFITNDEAIFELLQQEKANVVLEEISQAEDDGSLSLYCSRQQVRYVNVEAEHGHLQQQAAMLAMIMRILK